MMNHTSENQLATLFRSIASEFGHHQSDIANQGRRALLASINSPIEKIPAWLTQCKALPQSPAHNNTVLLQSILDCHEHLHWAESADNNGPEVFQAELAYVELLGPTGMVMHSDCRVGLLLLCRDNFYPAHRHAAEELYLVVDGTALWSSEQFPSTRRRPGAFVHHQSWETHAMTTLNEPMLAVWCWTGDLSFSSYEMVSDPRIGLI